MPIWKLEKNWKFYSVFDFAFWHTWTTVGLKVMLSIFHVTMLCGKISLIVTFGNIFGASIKCLFPPLQAKQPASQHYRTNPSYKWARLKHICDKTLKFLMPKLEAEHLSLSLCFQIQNNLINTVSVWSFFLVFILIFNIWDFTCRKYIGKRAENSNKNV